MKWLKSSILAVLRIVNPNLEYRLIEQFHFNKLGRRPPELIWQALEPGPVERLDAGGARIGSELFLFGGARLGGRAIGFLDIFDFDQEKWLKSIPLPQGMAHTHHGLTTDGNRYIYLISGQLGNYCSPPTRSCFVFDTLKRSWNSFVPLPLARYAPTAQIWNGRLHVIGGSIEDRTTPAKDHWSIAISEGSAQETRWRMEIPIPRGGPHRASAVINNRLYVFGGQEEDFIAIPGDPEFRCTGELTCDLVYPDTYMLENLSEPWQKMADMPVSSSHTENTVITNGQQVALVGGQYYKDPQTHLITITDVIQVYDADTDTWNIVGRLPYCIKETVATIYNDNLYFTTGQRDLGPHNPTCGPFVRGLWKAKINPALFWSSQGKSQKQVVVTP
jgi:hypothetical protein